MTVLNNTFLTLLDNAKSEHNGRALVLGTELYQRNDIVQDLVYDTANDGLSNVSGIITSLGTSSYMRFNQGTPSTKISIQDQVDKVEVIIKKFTLDNHLGMGMKDRDTKLQQYLEALEQGMSNDMTNDFFYGNPATNIDQMNGFAVKMGSSAIPTVTLASSSSSALTSIYIMTHGIRDMYAFYPEPGEGSKDFESWNSGINYVVRNAYVNDQTTTANQYFAEVHELMWGLAFTIKNHRTQARIANIPTGSLTSTSWNQAAPNSGGYELDDLITNSMLQMQNIDSDARVIYMNRVILAYLTRQLKHKNNMFFMSQQVLEGFKSPVQFVNGSRLRLVEQIRNNETQVS